MFLVPLSLLEYIYETRSEVKRERNRLKDVFGDYWDLIVVLSMLGEV